MTQEFDFHSKVKGDIYELMFDFFNFNTSEKFITNDNINVLGDLIQRCKNEDIYKLIDLGQINSTIDNNLYDNIDIKLFIKNFKHIKISNVESIRKIYGYALIYKVLKEQMNNIFTKNIDYKEFGLTMLLINNSDLIYENLFLVFRRINFYIDKKIYDAGLENCCLVMKAIFEYYPQLLQDKKEFLKAFFLFLITVVRTISNFPMIKAVLSSLKKLLNVLDHRLVIFLSYGIYLELIEEFKSKVIKEKNTIQMFVYLSLLKLLFIKSYDGGSRMYDFEELNIQDLVFYPINGEPFLYDVFIKAKYEFIDVTIKYQNEFKTDKFILDLQNCQNKFFVIKNIKNIQEHLNLSLFYNFIVDHQASMIYFISKPNILNNDIILSQKFFNKLVSDICDSKLLLLFTTYFLKNLKNVQKLRMSIITDIFVKSIEQSTQSEKIIIERILNFMAKQDLIIQLHFVKEVTEKVNQFYDVVLLLIILLIDSIDDLEFIIQYFQRTDKMYYKTVIDKYICYSCLAIISKKINRKIKLCNKLDNSIINLLVGIDTEIKDEIYDEMIELVLKSDIDEITDIKVLFEIFLGKKTPSILYDIFKLLDGIKPFADLQ